MGTIEEWQEFLGRRGSVHLIVELGENPQRFIDLKGRIPISPDTLSRQLKTGVKIGVFELDIIERNGRDDRVYRLTDHGNMAFDRLAEAGAVEASHHAREARADLEDARQALLDQLETDE